MFASIYQIAKNTCRETLREPIFLLILLTALCLIGIFPIIPLFVFREQVKLVVDSAMATTMLFGWLVAVLSSSNAIAREIENGTALLLLSKPVKRPAFVVAKISGVLVSLGFFCLLSSLATLIAVRVAKDQFRTDNMALGIYFGAIILSLIVAGIHNYIARSSFPMSAILAMLIIIPLASVIIYFVPVTIEHESKMIGLPFEIVPALVLVVYSVWAMGTLSTALSTRYNLVSNLLICSVIFIVGLMSDYLIGRHAREVWSDTVPSGKATLWISSYRFAHTEKNAVGPWNRPSKVADELLTVWTDKANPGKLQTELGDDPQAVWRDGGGWLKDVTALEEEPRLMAVYLPTGGGWNSIKIKGERASADNPEQGFTSFVFRRSVQRPRTPKGGTFADPMPSPGYRSASILYACVPNWQLFWMADALAAGKKIPLAYVLLGGVYVSLVILFLTTVAIVLFWNREVGGGMRV